METSGALTEWMTGLETAPGADPRAAQFPLSHAMPPAHGLTQPGWTTFHSRSVAEIRFCHQNPEAQTCNLTQVQGYEQ